MEQNVAIWHIPDTIDNRNKCGLHVKAETPKKDNDFKSNLHTNLTSLLTVQISNNNCIQLEKFLDQLKLKAYSPSTINVSK